MDFMGRALRAHEDRFLVVLLEKVLTRPPGGFTHTHHDLLHVRRRENSWINRLDSVRNGYNSKSEILAPPRLSLPNHMALIHGPSDVVGIFNVSPPSQQVWSSNHLVRDGTHPETGSLDGGSL